MEVEQCAGKRWTVVNSTENSVEEEDDEALSLCDLPLNIHHSGQEREEHDTPFRAHETDHQEDFDFCSLSQESEMCAADEVFYQGQILPLHRPIRRSESMDYYFSSKSSSSGSGSSTATADRKLQLGNRFHSPPSPSPKLHFPRNKINSRNCGKTSSTWSVLRLGIIAAPPGIVDRDFKTRFHGKNISCSNDKKKKNKQWDLLGGSCKCSFDAVDTVPSEVVVKRNATDGLQADEENLVAMKSPKKRLSQHRPFEWLKELE